MKRNLINYDVLKKMEHDSVSSAESELLLAEDILGNALGKDIRELHCFGESNVLYETFEGTFIHANYSLENDHIVFENIEELVIDEESEAAAAREVLVKMVEALLDEEKEKANQLFETYIELPVVRRSLLETKITGSIIKKRKSHKNPLAKKKQSASFVAKRARAKKKAGRKRSAGDKHRMEIMRDRFKKRLGGRKDARVVVRASEAYQMAENVLQYVDYVELGPVVSETVVKHDDRGGVVAIKIPNARLRTEGRLISFNWKTLDHKNIMLRNGGKNLAENNEFCKAIAALKRYHSVSDDTNLEESIDGIVSHYPSVLYLTQGELASVLGEALTTAGTKSFDDAMCDYLAEGILRKAHASYTDRVDSILKFAGMTNKLEEKFEDSYQKFQQAAEKYYPTLDENAATEMQVFVDLYNVVRDIQSEAIQQDYEMVAEDANIFLKDLYAVISNDIEPDLGLAEEVAEWLQDLAETNLNSQDWNVNNTPHMTVSGDHPEMAKKAKHSYSPASDGSGDWGDSAPVSDGASYRGGLASKMRNSSYGNIGGPDTDPSLRNPYVPSPYGDWTMKGEKGVDKEDGGFVYTSGDTWPELQNPYVPQAIGADGWRAKTDNLVIEK